MPDVALEIEHFTDPACPVAFSAEPVRQRLRWHYGEQLHWRHTLVVITVEAGHAERLAEGAPNLQRSHGMPIDPNPLPRPASCEPACRAVVAARLHAPERHERLLRELRVRTMAGGLLDDPELIAAAARSAGIDPGDLDRWVASDKTTAELAADMAAARKPSPAARALDHKLAGPRSERRYSTPSYEIRDAATDRSICVPGLNPFEAYSIAVANLDPAIERRRAPSGAAELLAWASEPLATVEIVAILDRDPAYVRAELARVAQPTAAGADFYWQLA
ncbi:MAG TPA: DsbA family protein [Solirubrobacteraceae bacterium]|jgi:predicted DsbA family dithiol-disulfide isomerase